LRSRDIEPRQIAVFGRSWKMVSERAEPARAQADRTGRWLSRRLIYVGCGRARERLPITYSEGKILTSHIKFLPHIYSRSVDEICQHCPVFASKSWL
jgi:superfamily I DNA/RNA helicase